MTYQMKVDIEHPEMEPEDDMEILYDVYDTELKEGDKFYMNTYGELIHAENLVRYLIEENLVAEYTR